MEIPTIRLKREIIEHGVVVEPLQKRTRMQTPRVIYFWAPERKFGFLSNWYPATFEDYESTNIDTINDSQLYRTFSSVQQYMIYHRVLLFGEIPGNHETAAKVLETESPNELKKLGQNIKGFNVEKWNLHKEHIVMKGIYLKFKQNPKLYKQLMNTGDAMLAEGSKFDKNWGIGMNIRDAIIQNDPSKWKGKNLMGKCLMEVRSYLQNESV